MEKQKIRIGKISKPHGLKGEFKIYPLSNDIEAFKTYNKVYVESINEPYHLNGIKKMNGFLIGKFDEINNIDELSKIIGKYIFIEYSDRRKLDKNEFLIRELIGMDVYEKEVYLGKVEDVLTYSANDVFVVKNDDKTRMIPNVSQFVKKIDMDKNEILVELIEGM